MKCQVLKNGNCIVTNNYSDNHRGVDLVGDNYNTDFVIAHSDGDIVKINGVYVSSQSKNKLRPLITEGKITKVIDNARNPYLLNYGKIGWVNDDCIVDGEKIISSIKYNGYSIVDALNMAGVDSSFKKRMELAKLNNINNYVGSAEQNTKMLNLLKTGKLILK